MKIIIEIEPGSEFQKNVIKGTLEKIFKIAKQDFESKHKKNKLNYKIITEEEIT